MGPKLKQAPQRQSSETFFITAQILVTTKLQLHVDSLLITFSNCS